MTKHPSKNTKLSKEDYSNEFYTNQYVDLCQRMYERMQRENSWPWIEKDEVPSQLKQKVCCVVLQDFDHNPHILSFIHPHAGKQFVKGSIEGDETTQQAAVRELNEESGISSVLSTEYMGSSIHISDGEEWHFVYMQVSQQAMNWSHYTQDGGGLQFHFFWHPLATPLDENWDKKFHNAFGFIKENL